MDFIEGLPPSGQFNCIIVFVDPFTKYAHFVPLRHPFSAAHIVDVFLDTVFKLHSMPLSLVSDRDKIFTSNFWQGVFKRTGTDLNMSTAYHPQSDGQTERVNQQIECYLRCFISAHPKQWSKWLPLCEFWYNSNWHSALGKSPFEVLYGYSPRYFGLSADDSLPPTDVQHWLEERLVMQESVRQHLLRVKQRMKHQSDKQRTEREFAVGDQVFLKLQPYAQSSVAHRASHKLSFKYFGPYSIIKKIGSVAYELQLPLDSRIHPVFHVSQLKKFIPPTIQVQPLLPTLDDDLQVPLAVLQHRLVQRGKASVAQVLIRWSDSPIGLATWEDLDSIRQRFPRAPAWGQAVSKEAGIVNNTSKEGQADCDLGRGPDSSTRPRRERRLPARLADSVWVR
jgi:ribosomal protein L21E